jgi:inhibitor of the pro-sigma K processing machinery
MFSQFQPWQVWASFGLLAVLLCLIGFAFRRFVPALVRMVLFGALGLVGIVVINLIGTRWGFGIAINPVTIGSVGILGPAGLLAVIVCRLLVGL